jgi:hypothetical protein
VDIATQVRLLPEVIDISIVPTLAGVGSLLAAIFGAARRYPPSRLGRITLLGTLAGGMLGLGILAVFVVLEVLS